MKKRIICVLFAVFIILSMAIIPASAESEYICKLVDSAEILDPQEEDALIGKIYEVSNKCGCNVLFITAKDLTGAAFTFNGTAEDYTIRYYEETCGRGTDGLVVSIILSDQDGDRSVSVLGSGKCVKRLSDGESADIRSDAIDNHNPGSVTSATSKSYAGFLSAIADGLMKAVPPHVGFKSILIAFGVGLIIAIIVSVILRGQLKSVKRQHGAANYVHPGSMMVNASRDTYLYSTVSRTARPKDNGGSHSSSSGGSYSGGSSKF